MLSAYRSFFLFIWRNKLFKNKDDAYKNVFFPQKETLIDSINNEVTRARYNLIFAYTSNKKNDENQFPIDTQYQI